MSKKHHKVSWDDDYRTNIPFGLRIYTRQPCEQGMDNHARYGYSFEGR